MAPDVLDQAARVVRLADVGYRLDALVERARPGRRRECAELLFQLVATWGRLADIQHRLDALLAGTDGDGDGT